MQRTNDSNIWDVKNSNICGILKFSEPESDGKQMSMIDVALNSNFSGNFYFLQWKNSEKIDNACVESLFEPE